MKKIKLIMLSSTLALCMACSHADKSASSTDDTISVKSAAIQSADSLNNGLNKDKSEFKAKLDTLIASTDVKLKEFDKKIAKASKKEKKNLEADKIRMQQHRDELKKDLEEVDKKADADWKKFKETVSAAVDSLKADL